jgi:signal transduction histidine kinase/DNA-binding response OmpR family regulator
LPERRSELVRVHRNSLRLLRLVNTLLDFSRIEAGRVQASYEPVDLAMLTSELASVFRSATDKAGLRLVVDCPPLAQEVWVDRDMWEKIVLNLVSNAFKYTLAGTITVRLRQVATTAVLTIEDTGIGIPADELPHLFDRFHRVAGARGRTHEGTGIGLALVQELVKLHAGEVRAESVVDAGSAFTVSIPVGTSHLPRERLKAERTLASTGLGAQPFLQEALRWLPGASSEDSETEGLPLRAELASAGTESVAKARSNRRGGQRPLIVLADDNADMRDYVSRLLSTQYEVQAVADGAAALAHIRERRPDLLLSDVMMPRLDGFGLVRAIRSDAELLELPIILLSARAGEEASIEGLEVGADDYLVKPFSARELLARVSAALKMASLRRELEARLRARTAEFETLLNAAPLCVCVVDQDLRICEANPQARAVLGGDAELIGRDFAALAHGLWQMPYARDLVRLLRHVLETGEPHSAPERLHKRLDRAVTEYYDWQINRIPLPEGRDGVVCYFRDISARVLARLRLEAADRHKNEFLAMLAHELRNPLAPIRNAGELLTRALPPDQRTQALTSMLQRQAKHLTRLVDDLLDVSRITQGRIELKRHRVRIADVIAQAVETVEPTSKEKGQTIRISSSGNPWVHADHARLVQCLVNVLMNAVKYTQPGGAIRVNSLVQGGEAVLSIVDNGAGISAELLPHVFDLFVQSERTLDRAQGGLGVGLSVVKRLIEMHAGRVSACSAGPGRGATIEIRLPLAAEAEEPHHAAAAHEIVPRRVLVLDDNADAVDSLGMLLQLDGHEVLCTYNSREALEKVQGFRPDAVLLDIGLPEIDGYEVARRLRALPDLEGVRLIALTGYGQAEDRQRVKAAGFDDHLTKPVDFEALQQCLSARAGARETLGLR